MEHFKFVKILCIAFSLVFFVDIANFSFVRNYLLCESRVISYYISRDCGLSGELVTYIKDKEYVLVYDEDNSKKVGDLVSYILIKTCDSVFIESKEIKIIQYVVLGSN